MTRGRVLTILFLVALAAAPGAALGCEVCYGEAEGPMIDAARASVGLMLGLVIFFQIVFGVFFYRLWRRQRRFRQDALPRAPIAHDEGAP